MNLESSGLRDIRQVTEGQKVHVSTQHEVPTAVQCTEASNHTEVAAKGAAMERCWSIHVEFWSCGTTDFWVIVLTVT